MPSSSAGATWNLEVAEVISCVVFKYSEDLSLPLILDEFLLATSQV